MSVVWAGPYPRAVDVAMGPCEHTCIDHACTFVGNQTPLYLIHNMGLWLIMWKPVKKKFF